MVRSCTGTAASIAARLAAVPGERQDDCTLRGRQQSLPGWLRLDAPSLAVLASLRAMVPGWLTDPNEPERILVGSFLPMAMVLIATIGEAAGRPGIETRRREAGEDVALPSQRWRSALATTWPGTAAGLTVGSMEPIAELGPSGEPGSVR